MDTELGKRMIERADKDGLPPDHEIRTTAIAFEEGTKGFFAAEQTINVKQFMGRYARAKLAWNKYSGDPLV